MSGTAQRQLDEVFDDFKDTAYRLVRPLADGGMGSVFVGEHVKLARPCVIKLLLPKLSKRPEIIERLVVEGRILANIESENLVKVTDLSVTPGGRAFIAMELLSGKTLRDHLAERPTLAPLEAIEILVQVLHGLDVAHQAGVVHRDVKLDNLFVCSPNAEGRRVVKVLDFGIAKVLSASLKADVKFETTEGRVLGTPLYMSPEQATAQPVDARSDVYSAGVVLFRAITGQVPFLPPASIDQERAMFEIFKMHVERPPPIPSSIAPQAIPADLDACVLKALAKRPADRYQSARDFAAALSHLGQRLGANLGARAPRPLPSATEVLPAARGHAALEESAASMAATLAVRPAVQTTNPKRRKTPLLVYLVIAVLSTIAFTVALLELTTWGQGR